MKITGKILSVALTVCMLLTAVPLAGFVGLKLPDFCFSISASAAEVTSGTCGMYVNNLNWTLADTGLLTIEGTGAMASWTSSSKAPWYSSRSSIKKVILGSEVTSIGDYAFYNCTALTEIDFSGCTKLSSIGDSAFQMCTALTEVDLSGGSTLSHIGSSAFYWCSNLTEINLSDCTALSSIESSAFYWCSKLTEINLSGCTDLSSIRSTAFSGCSALTDIRISNDNTYYTIKDGVLFNKAMTEIVWYPDNKTDTSYTVPATVTAILGCAFDGCDSLTEIDFSACIGLRSIGDEAFSHCAALTEIDLFACTDLRSIGAYAFDNCTAMTEIKIGSDACEVFNNSATIPTNAVIFCNAASRPQAYARKYSRTYKALDGHSHELTETIVVPSCTVAEHTAHICSICSETLYFDNVLPADGHTDENSDGICNNCGAAYASITASGACGEGLLWSLDSNGLLTIEGVGEMASWTSSSNVPWDAYHSSIKKVIIGSGITSIGNYAFQYCRAMTEIDLTDCTVLSSIGNWAFTECTALTEVDLSDCTALSYIGGSAFLGCNALTEIDFSACTALRYLGSSAFYWCSNLTAIDLSGCPDLSFIGSYAFAGCTDLTEVDLSGCTALSIIGSGAFSDCTSLTEISISNDNQYYTSTDGVLYNKALTELIHYPAGKTDTLYTVPATVIEICDFAFENCTKLTEVDFSACTALSHIGYSAFRVCSALKAIDLSACTALSYIGYYAFKDCTALTEIDLSECTALSSIRDEAFIGCDSLTAILISNDNQYYTSPGGVLYNKAMTELICYPKGKTDTSYTVPATVTEIFGSAFYGCNALTEIDLSACTALSVIGYSAFRSCYALTEIDLSACSSLRSIGDYAFYWCSKLTSINLSACTALSSIGANAFYFCRSLTEIKIGNQYCEINDSANTIYSGATIYGYAGSTAEAYATKYNRTFIALNPHTHTPGDWVVTLASTCTTTGSRSRSCTDCLELLETENIPALGHTVIDDIAVAPTCTETGLTAGTHCSVCEMVITAQTVVAELGHIDDNKDDVCDRCAAELESEEPSENCSCSCHKSGFSSFIWKLKCFFYKIFNIEGKRYCECGKAHW